MFDADRRSEPPAGGSVAVLESALAAVLAAAPAAGPPITGIGARPVADVVHPELLSRRRWVLDPAFSWHGGPTGGAGGHDPRAAGHDPRAGDDTDRSDDTDDTDDGGTAPADPDGRAAAAAAATPPADPEEVGESAEVRRLLAAGAGPLDRAVAAARVIAAQSAVLAVAMAEFARCRPAALLDRGPGDRGAMSAATRAARPAALTDVSEWAVDELASALQISSTAAGAQLAGAITLVERLPATLALLAGGELSPAHARTMVDTVGPVADDGLRAGIEEHVLGLRGSKTPPQLGDCARRIVLRRDAEAAARRLVAAVRERGVRMHDRRDGTASVTIDLPLPTAAAIHRALEAYAAQARRDGDERTKLQRMADCLTDLVLRPGEHGMPPVTIALTLVATLETMLGGAEPGQVEGHLVPAAMVRELAYTFGLMPRPAPDLTGLPDAATGADATDEGTSGEGTSGEVALSGDAGGADARDDDVVSEVDPRGDEPAAAAKEAATADAAAHQGSAHEGSARAPAAAAPAPASDPPVPPPAPPPPGTAAPPGRPAATEGDDAAKRPAATPVGDRTLADWLSWAAERHRSAIDDGLSGAAVAIRAGVWTDGELRAVLDLGALIGIRDLAGTALAHRPHIAVVDQLRGSLVALTDATAIRRGRALGPPPPAQGYTPGAALDRFVRLRDRRCRFTGCRARARTGDLDHRRPWPAGPTAHTNLDSVCEHHHRLKHQAPGWRFDTADDGALVITTPTGRTSTSHPPRFGTDLDVPPF